LLESGESLGASGAAATLTAGRSPNESSESPGALRAYRGQTSERQQVPFGLLHEIGRCAERPKRSTLRTGGLRRGKSLRYTPFIYPSLSLCSPRLPKASLDYLASPRSAYRRAYASRLEVPGARGMYFQSRLHAYNVGELLIKYRLGNRFLRPWHDEAIVDRN
jgi:hypothetical protein